MNNNDEWIGWVVIVIIVVAIVFSIFNFATCIGYWNKPAAETPARCFFTR